MVLPKKLFSLLTAQSLMNSEKSEETSVIRDFPFGFLVTMYVRSRLCIRTYVEVTFCICTYVEVTFCICTYVEVTFCWSRYFFLCFSVRCWSRFFTRLSSCLFWREGVFTYYCFGAFCKQCWAVPHI